MENPQSTGYHGVELGWDSKRALLQTSTCRQQKSTTGCQSYKPKAQGGVLSVFCLGRRGKGVGRGEGTSSIKANCQVQVDTTIIRL